jgi:hypothetical protein
MKCDSWASLLALILASPYLGHEPKARVTTTSSCGNGMKFEHMLLGKKGIVAHAKIALVPAL